MPIRRDNIIQSEQADISNIQALSEISGVALIQKIDLEDQDLQNILVKLSKNKIAVDNPNYSTYKKLLD